MLCREQLQYYHFAYAITYGRIYEYFHITVNVHRQVVLHIFILPPLLATWNKLQKQEANINNSQKR